MKPLHSDDRTIIGVVGLPGHKISDPDPDPDPDPFPEFTSYLLNRSLISMRNLSEYRHSVFAGMRSGTQTFLLMSLPVSGCLKETLSRLGSAGEYSQNLQY